ncbi:MAG: hypothetical protein Kow0042_14700 [Calditrichia bacterium]
MIRFKNFLWVMIYAAIIGIAALPSSAYSQTIWQCETIGPDEDYLLQQGITSYSPQLQSVTVRIFIHVIRRSDGSGGLDSSEVSNALDVLRADFLSRNIYFTEIGRDTIDNNNYFDFTGRYFSYLIQENPHNDAIDIYLLPPHIFYGRASGIPGIALVLGGGYAGTSVLSHEMGHCLGLWHTHSGRGCNDFANCPEAIDGSNCATCGDLVCDTPADPCLNGNVNAQCQYIGPPPFTPNVENIISYTPPECMTHFTPGQFDRVFTMIENSPLLQNVIEQPILVTVDQRLSNGSSIDSVARWVASRFDTFAVPQDFGFTVGYTEVFPGAQKIISNEKYNNWNGLSDVTNHHVFVIDSLTTELVSNFDPTKPGITIRNALLSAPGSEGGVIEFKNPWLIDYPDPLYGNHKRNRGMAAPFKSRSSPFNPDYTTRYNGDVYQGVFLDQVPDPSHPEKPYYSVRAPQQQVIPFHGEDITWYFQGWSGTGVQFQHPDQTETAVVFKQD